MVVPLKDSNLAHIGSTEDKAAKKAAAELKVDWEGAGKNVGIQIWRVENSHDEEGGTHKFGIDKWPEKMYGQFYSGDSYIVLQTTKGNEGNNFLYDVYFWIGSESSQDEFGVAAYKATELDNLLGDAPVQHRELEGHESSDFKKCFSSNGIRYLKGGHTSGFRNVDESDDPVTLPTCLFQIRKDETITRSRQVPATCESLNHGDTFVLDTGSVVYTWFGNASSPFEKSKAAEIAHSIVLGRNGHATMVSDVDEETEDFWKHLDGTVNDIKEASEFTDEDMNKAENAQVNMYIVKDVDSQLQVESVEAKEENLSSNDVCIIDVGDDTTIVWIGKGASERELEQSMLMAKLHQKNFGRENCHIVRIMEGQESRCSAWSKVFQ